MPPALGQGLNSGLEDAAIFAHCLERHQGNVDATLPAYNKLRLPDVQAILTINEVVSTNDVGLKMLVSLIAWLINPCLLAHPVFIAITLCLPFMLVSHAPSSPCEYPRPLLLVSPTCAFCLRTCLCCLSLLCCLTHPDAEEGRQVRASSCRPFCLL